MSAVCPAGHASDETDYCSVCGVAIAAGAVRLTPTPPHPSHRAPRAQACPVCGEARASGARFCEVCRYDFVSGAAGPPPKSVPAAPPPASAAPPVAPATSSRWQLVLTIDPSLDTEPDPAAPPPVEPERVFPVELAEMLVGRRDDRQNIRPAVPVHDPGASRRHARFLLGADGTVSLHDLASTNGTKLNGKDVVSGSVVRLQAGDEVTLGRWTRIRLQVRP
jgi:hypothetical protein